jgi:hypothetical protein
MGTIKDKHGNKEMNFTPTHQVVTSTTNIGEKCVHCFGLGEFVMLTQVLAKWNLWRFVNAQGKMQLVKMTDVEVI